MGKIFLFDEIQNGLVPKPDNFAVAKRQAFDGLQQLVTKDEVVGAMVFGSVAKGTPSERSDFDLLVITRGKKPLGDMKDVFDFIFYSTRVEIEPIIIPETLAEKGFHTMDESFFIHLRNVPDQGNVIGTPPLDIVTPSGFPIIKVHEQYLMQKLRRLREGIFTHSEVDEYRVLQRALEAPINTGRRTLQALGALGALDAQLLDDGKIGVKNLFREVFRNTPLREGFDALIQRDEAYTTLLRSALSGDVSRQEYQDEVRALANEAIPQAVSWVSEISSLYISALEGNKIGVEGRPNYGGKER